MYETNPGELPQGKYISITFDFKKGKFFKGTQSDIKNARISLEIDKKINNATDIGFENTYSSLTKIKSDG